MQVKSEEFNQIQKENKTFQDMNAYFREKLQVQSN